MKIENLSLAEIVTQKPEAAVILENYNLDYCCGGKRKLGDTLKNDVSKLNHVIDDLEKLFGQESIPENDFDKFSLSRLVDYIIEVHHSYVKANLPVIQQHLEKVSLKHGDTHPEMRKIKLLFDEIKRDFEQHMMKEEIILFPRIKKIESLSHAGILSTENFALEAPIHVMEFEHDAAGKLMEEIKKLSNNYLPPQNACTTFRLSLDELKIFESDLHLHVHLENNILFPKALAMQEKLSNMLLN
jgi:regulator of cell morphogenesis and NO signaling